MAEPGFNLTAVNARQGLVLKMLDKILLCFSRVCPSRCDDDKIPKIQLNSRREEYNGDKMGKELGPIALQKLLKSKESKKIITRWKGRTHFLQRSGSQVR